MVEDKKLMASTRCNVGSWPMAFLQSWFTSGKDQVKLTFSNFKIRNGNTAFYSLWHPALLFLNFEPVLSALRLLSSELQCNKERRCAWLHGQPRRPSAGYKSENTSFYSSEPCGCFPLQVINRQHIGSDAVMCYANARTSSSTYFCCFIFVGNTVVLFQWGIICHMHQASIGKKLPLF